MARKIKFALEMADGTFVSVLEDLQSHIKNNDDLKKLVEYFLDGRLERWLEDRYYEEEANALKSVNKDEPDFACKLCKAIGADYTPMESVNIGLIEHEKKIRKALEEVTDDTKIIKNAGCTACNQAELDFLIKNGKKTIYLWGNSFNLPVVDNISYMGVLVKPSIDIKLADLEALKSHSIKFENVKLPERFERAEKEVIKKVEKELLNLLKAEERRIAEEKERERRIAEEKEKIRAEEEARRDRFRYAGGLDVWMFGEEEARRNPFKSAKVGDYIKFGNYPQSSNGQNQPIEWQVLSIENNKMIVISRYGLDAKCFDPSSNNWKNSEIRKWLNGEFYNKAFTDQEKKSINPSNLSDVGTTDNVFFLSKEEAEKYFVNNEARKCKATDYAKKNGDRVSNMNYRIWWLRSPCLIPFNFPCYVLDGDVFDFKLIFINYNGIVRPAIWINI